MKKELKFTWDNEEEHTRISEWEVECTLRATSLASCISEIKEVLRRIDRCKVKDEISPDAAQRVLGIINEAMEEHRVIDVVENIP